METTLDTDEAKGSLTEADNTPRARARRIRAEIDRLLAQGLDPDAIRQRFSEDPDLLALVAPWGANAARYLRDQIAKVQTKRGIYQSSESDLLRSLRRQLATVEAALEKDPTNARLAQQAEHLAKEISSLTGGLVVAPGWKPRLSSMPRQARQRTGQYATTAPERQQEAQEAPKTAEGDGDAWDGKPWHDDHFDIPATLAMMAAYEVDEGEPRPADLTGGRTAATAPTRTKRTCQAAAQQRQRCECDCPCGQTCACGQDCGCPCPC